MAPLNDWFGKLMAGVFAVAFALGLMFIDEPGAETTPPPAPPSRWDERVYALDVEAIEAAYKDQIKHIFMVWMKDSTGQPNRAINGALQARKAFVGSMDAIDERRRK